MWIPCVSPPGYCQVKSLGLTCKLVANTHTYIYIYTVHGIEGIKKLIVFYRSGNLTFTASSSSLHSRQTQSSYSNNSTTVRTYRDFLKTYMCNEALFGEQGRRPAFSREKLASSGLKSGPRPSTSNATGNSADSPANSYASASTSQVREQI